MAQTHTLLEKILYFTPRLILFSIIMFSLVISLVISLVSLALFRPALNAIRQTIVSWFGV